MIRFSQTYSSLPCLDPDSPVTFAMKQTVSLPAPVQAYRPESLGVASRICSTSCFISVRLLVPRELPSLVQVMVPVAGGEQLSVSTSPGCTEYSVGLQIWYLFDASAERMGKEWWRGETGQVWRKVEGAQERGGRGRNKPECKKQKHHMTPMDALQLFYADEHYRKKRPIFKHHFVIITNVPSLIWALFLF